ncbi:MAG: hypothetical protein C5S52_07360 [ANME-2 cluster archaeon]|nr:hypothetical protein [ANME-2 cluster archaeon]
MMERLKLCCRYYKKIKLKSWMPRIATIARVELADGLAKYPS